MTKEEFEADQMRRKGYICPANEFNPDYHGEPAAVICPRCAHYKKKLHHLRKEKLEAH